MKDNLPDSAVIAEASKIAGMIWIWKVLSHGLPPPGSLGSGPLALVNRLPRSTADLKDFRLPPAVGSGYEILHSAKFELSYLGGLNSGREVPKPFLDFICQGCRIISA